MSGTRGTTGTNRPVLVMIHGINSNGEWHKLAEDVLQSHFECVSYTYPGYRTVLGALRVVAGKQHTAAVDELAEALGRFASMGRPPTVLAHSFGTYLTGMALDRRPGLTVGPVVLVGAVLPREFDWGNVFRRGQLRRVINYLGARDWVVRLAGFARHARDDLGDIGVVGVPLSSKCSVHNVNDVEPCGWCSTWSGDIHNIRLLDNNHQTMLDGKLDCAAFVLPHLWQICPQDYSALCNKASQFTLAPCHASEELLAQTRWNWMGERNLIGVLASLAQHSLRARGNTSTPPRDVADVGLKVFADILSTALLECGKTARSRVDAVARCRDPRVAARVAIDTVLG